MALLGLGEAFRLLELTIMVSPLANAWMTDSKAIPNVNFARLTSMMMTNYTSIVERSMNNVSFAFATRVVGGSTTLIILIW